MSRHSSYPSSERPPEDPVPSREELEARLAALERENAALRRTLPGADVAGSVPDDRCDDTGRDRFEREIIESRNIVRALIDSSDDYFALVDERFTIHACNLAWSRAIDIHPRQLVGRNFLALIPSGSRGTVRAMLRACLRDNVPQSFTISFEERTFDCRLTPLGPEADSPRMVTCAAHDITRLLQAEKLQQEMELRYKTVFDSAGDAIFIHDLQGAFLDANLVFRQLLGYGLEQIRTFRLQDLVSRSDNPPDLLGETDAMLTFQVDLKRADGSVLPLDVSARRITFDGKTALLCIGRDITQRRRVEGMLLKAKESAESNVRMQNEFVANISHELRTPLSSIIGITELLSLTGLDDSQRENLDRIAYSADMLLGLINDLLDLSRLESGTFSMASRPFSLLELMREIKNIFLEKVASKNLNFSYDIAETVPEYMLGDAMRLKQVLINIVGNAIKFTAEGSVRVAVSVAEEPALAPELGDSLDGASSAEGSVPILFEVVDSGIGMSDADLRRIFHRFTQGDNTSGRPYGGAGLGLSISRQLILLMGGDITAASSPNEGSTFRFVIRLPSALKPEPQPAPFPGSPSDVPRLRVLLVEDNEINRDMIESMIAVDGHEVRTATDGLDALETLRDFTPDIVFMDLQMPHCDGYEAAARIRDLPDPAVANVPIIALSAHAQKPPEDEWRSARMDGYLSKPIQLETLHKAIASVGDGSMQSGNLDKPAAPAPETPPLLDLGTLRKNMGDNDDLVRLACEKFLSHADRYIADLTSALARRDRKDAKRFAHSFKSVLGTIGAEQARLVAQAMEKEAPTEGWELLESRVARLDELVRQLHGLLEDTLS